MSHTGRSTSGHGISSFQNLSEFSSAAWTCPWHPWHPAARDCKVLKYPEIPNLTRKSQTYSISFGPKQSTDWEVNQFVVQTCLEKKIIAYCDDVTYIYMIINIYIYEHIKVETVTKSRTAKFEWKSDLLVSTHAA